MTECSLIETFKDYLPSTRENSRSIDHFLVRDDLMQFVTKAGRLPDESSFTSDHSGLFIDLSPKILDTKNAPITQPKNRKLKMSNPIKVAKYVELVLTQFQHHNIERRVEKLDEELKTKPFCERIGKQLNQLDQHISEIMLQSEDKLSPDSAPYAYSVELDTQMRTVRLIKKFIDKQNQKYSIETYANTEMEEIAAYISGLPLDQLPELLIQERKKLIEMQEDSWGLRDKMLGNILEQMEAESKKDKAKIIREMKEREKQSRMYQRLGSILKVINYANVTRLGLPAHLSQATIEEIWSYIQSTPELDLKKIEWEYTEDQQTIATRLIEWNMLHFNQACDTPLAAPEWATKLDPTTRKDDELEEILRSTITEGANLTVEAKCILEMIRDNINPLMPPETTNITLESFISFFKSTPEDKSSSPSGLHLGHYKAAVTNKKIAKTLWTILSIAFKHSFCLNRWKNSATTLIEKTSRPS